MSHRADWYNRKQRHKQITIKKFMVGCGYFNISFNSFLKRHEDHYSDYYKRYWHLYYLSGPKTFAKKQTHKKTRAKNRNLLSLYNNQEEEEMINHNIYHKQFDYWWTVY
jgi:hypothetical protein